MEAKSDILVIYDNTQEEQFEKKGRLIFACDFHVQIDQLLWDLDKAEHCGRRAWRRLLAHLIVIREQKERNRKGAETKDASKPPLFPKLISSSQTQLLGSPHLLK